MEESKRDPEEIFVHTRTQKELQDLNRNIMALQNYIRGVLCALARQGGIEGKFDVSPDYSRITEAPPDRPGPAR